MIGDDDQQTGRHLILPGDDDSEPAAGRSTEGRLVYAIGDVHGQLDLLEALVAEILRDVLASAPPQRPMLILLGDYVDRGPDSAGVLDCICRLQASSVLELRVLKGNHEEAVSRFLDDPAFGATWINFGGGATLASYGIDAPQAGEPLTAWVDARDRFAAALPATHRDLLEGLELMVLVGDYAFVHAGIRPSEPLDRQAEQDLLWIRGEFLDWAGPLDRMIVHGHTPAAQPRISSFRLGIDTGAYATGVLTAVRLNGAERQFIQAHGSVAPGWERSDRPSGLD